MNIAELCECERGNTWLMDSEEGDYILIGLDVNEDVNAKSQFLEISILPENYPGFRVQTINESITDMIAYIQERYEGWFCRKWNLTEDAPINEDSHILGVEVEA